MIRQRRSVATPVLAEELCREIRALVGDTSHPVLLEVLSGRLGVGWDELMQAVAHAARMGWVERRSDSVALRSRGRGDETGSGGAGAPGSQIRLLFVG